VKKFSFLSPLVLFALIFIIAWFGIMVWAKGPNVFKWTVQVTRDNGLTDEERAYQCLGIWTKLFDNDPMAKKWASDWNTRNVEFFGMRKRICGQFLMTQESVPTVVEIGEEAARPRSI